MADPDPYIKYVDAILSGCNDLSMVFNDDKITITLEFYVPQQIGRERIGRDADKFELIQRIAKRLRKFIEPEGGEK